MEGPLVNLEISIEEMGVVLVALATLHGMQGIKQPGQMTDQERDYVAATDSIMRKFCTAAGMPENFLKDMKAQAMRELMQRKNRS